MVGIQQVFPSFPFSSIRMYKVVWGSEMGLTDLFCLGKFDLTKNPKF